MAHSNQSHKHSSGQDCHELLVQLSDYIDGTLGKTLCDEIEAHLKICKNCTIVVDTLRKTIHLYQESSTSDRMPADMRDRLYKNLDLDDFLNKKED